MESKKLLSICIPVYNRASELNAALAAIESQYHPSVEIIISDNCSTDPSVGTTISAFQKRLPIRLFRQPFNCGAEENVMRVASYARGKYFLIHGSDDCLASGAMDTVIRLLHSREPDLVAYGYSISRVMGGSPVRINICPYRERLLEYPECGNVFDELPDLSCSFMFISSFIVRSSLWSYYEGRDDPSWVGSQYRHSCRIHKLISSGHIRSILASPIPLIEAATAEFELHESSLASSELSSRSQLEQRSQLGNHLLFYDAQLMTLLSSTVYSGWQGFPRGLLASYRRSHPVRQLQRETLLHGSLFIDHYCGLIAPIPLGMRYKVFANAVRKLARVRFLLVLFEGLLGCLAKIKRFLWGYFR